MPTGAGISFARPGPVAMNFDLIAHWATPEMPSINTGWQNNDYGSPMGITTIFTVDEFMPIVSTPPTDPTTLTGAKARFRPTAPTSSLPSPRSGSTAARSRHAQD